MKLILERNYGEYDSTGTDYHAFECESKEIAELELLEKCQKALNQYLTLQKESEDLRMKIKTDFDKQLWINKYSQRNSSDIFNFYDHQLTFWDFYHIKKTYGNKSGNVKSVNYEYIEPTIMTLDEFWTYNLGKDY